MKRFAMVSVLVFTMVVFLFTLEGYSKKKDCPPDLQKITLKLATLAPGISVANEGMNTLRKSFDLVGPKFGICPELITYFGGVMGDDPQMIQKARAGQLDVLAITLNGLPLISNAFDILNMAYLIEDYGMFDYVINRTAPLINKVFWDNGWISLALVISDGPHDLYLNQPYRTLEELKKNLKAANYTGGPDDSFFRPLGIAQVPVGPTELFPSVRSGVINGALLPSAFTAGMQLYTSLKYIVHPSVRYSTSTAIMTKRKWETIPWDFRIYMATLQPAVSWGTCGIIKDLAYAFTEALIKHGCKKVVLTNEELKALRDPVLAYREKYVGNDKTKRELYNAVLKAIEEYKTGNPIEKQIFLADPTYKNFADKVNKVVETMGKYQKTRDLNILATLHKEKVLEKWRVYDAAVAQREFARTGNSKKLEEWMRIFYTPEVCDEIFSKHKDSLKKLFGSEKAVDERMEEAMLSYNTGAGFYKGFQKFGIESNRAVNKEE